MAELIQRCHDEILFLDNPDATRPETLTMAQEMVIQHRTRQLDQLVQADGSKWTKLKKDQIRLWTMINTVFRSDWLPEIKQWAPLLGKMKLGGVMGESTQLPLYRKDVELAQKISRLRLPPSNTWTILEALYGRQAVHKVERKNSRLHEAYGEDSGVLETETVAKWIAKHGDVTVCKLFIKLGNARKRRQVVNFTSCDRTTAARILRNHNWNAEQAINGYFNNGGGGAGGAKPYEANLNQIFDKYIDNPQDKDTVGVDGTMKYLADLDVPLDDITSLAILELVQAPTMGEITRKGFVDGWTARGADSIDKQKTAVSQLRASLSDSSSRAVMKRVYKHTFVVAKPPGQKAIPLEQAIEYWRLLYSSTGLNWETSTTPWLEWWIEFLESKWKRTVNKDMWDQLFNFAEKSLGDETLSFWSEDGAWPGVIDEFVDWVRTEKGRGAKPEGDEEMED
ncbi:putative defective in cullin neddylation protein 1 protein [Neofusicoccum parvum UCRNP2]|uniref:Defective in cullin neddylation protein n=1 Tax=Botryosphaeria parva (strain UCR-NP2) TaxID=1287680 RepID=R1GEH2_BOTPV|nr:putative defective in cullin neddylation protein 1 protein [Neofusicoccum parvum UCRNP2]